MNSEPWGFRQELGKIMFWEPESKRRLGGTVCAVGVDGSFLIRPNFVPDEWLFDGNEDPRKGRLVPQFFLVDANLRSSTHRKLHAATQYRFQPEVWGQTLLEQITNLHVSNPSIGGSNWYAKKFRQMGLKLPKGYEGFRVVNNDGNFVYFLASDKAVYGSTVGIFGRMDANGTIAKIFEAPGRFLACSPHPLDSQKLLISAEGYPQEDPRNTSFFEVDLRSGNWRVIAFPTAVGHQLYGSRICFFEEHGILLLNRYGFVPEGGGLWLANFGHPDYEPKKRLLGWDHSQVWLYFETADPQVWNVFFTAKEVDNNFSMTLNRAVLHLDGVNTYLTDPLRIGKVKGWNPVPFRIERIGPYRHLIYVASNSYDAYMKGQAAGVYVVVSE